MFRKFRAFEASSIFEFVDPDTGFKFKAGKLMDLYKDIILYRQQNNLTPIESLNHVVENYLCSLPENCNKCQENDTITRSFSQYIQGGIALLKNMAFKKYASQHVAETRGAQCSTCRFNVFPDKSGFLAWADDIAISQVGERKVSMASELGSCSVCQCPLRGKIFVADTLPKFPDDQVDKLKSVSCWQLKLSSQ